MRVADYSQRTAATRASLFAVMLLVLTILQGTSTLLTLIYHFNQSLEPVSVLLWFVSYMVALGGLMFTHGINWMFWLFRYRLLLVLLTFGVIASIGWSIDANVSTARVVHLVGSSLIAIYLGFMVPLTTILTVMSWVLGGILLASIGVVAALPALGIEQYEGAQVWRGIMTSKNTLGFWAAIGCLLYVSQWSRAYTATGRLSCIVLLIVSLGCLYFSKSATSLLALVVGGTAALYFYVTYRFKLGFVRMVAMAILFIGLIVVAVLNIDTAELVGRSGDLTGRGEVWQQTWNLILQKPLTGFGYGSIWNPNDATLWIQQKLTDFTWIVYHAHNGFLQVASELGLPLATLAVLMVVQQLIEIFYCQYQRQQAGVLFVLGFVIAYLVSNYSEARFLVNRELYWILFLALPISMLRQVTVVLPDPVTPDSPDSSPDNTDSGPFAPSTAPSHDHTPHQTAASTPLAVAGAANPGSAAKRNNPMGAQIADNQQQPSSDQQQPTALPAPGEAAQKQTGRRRKDNQTNNIMTDDPLAGLMLTADSDTSLGDAYDEAFDVDASDDPYDRFSSDTFNVPAEKDDKGIDIDLSQLARKRSQR